MAELTARKRAGLPATSFAYVDSKGQRRLPINDEAHVRNALARFNQVSFESEAARERARKRLLSAAKKYGIVPIGFMTGQLRTQQGEAAAGRLVIELGHIGSPAELEERLRVVLGDATLAVLVWSESLAGYLDGHGAPASLPSDGDGRAVTRLERQGRPMTALVHDPAILRNKSLVKTVTAAVQLALENELLRGQIEARAIEVHTLPIGVVTFLLTDIEASTNMLRRLGDRYAALVAEVRAVHRAAIDRAGGREVDARADEFFAVFEQPSAALAAAVEIQHGMADRTWPDELEVRVRIGLHTGEPALTDTGYVGLAVHTAARVSSAAHGGQILLSPAAREAVGGAARAGIGFVSLGAHTLQGLPEPLELHQVIAPGLGSAFPLPRTYASPKLEAR